MRPIKYRAWDKTEKKMYDLRDMYFNVSIDHPRVVFEMPFEMVDEDWKDHDLVLLEFTGLKDRNGTEIYEGDLLDDGVSIGEVKYIPEHAAFLVAATTDGNRAFHRLEGDMQLNYTEVVGNVFENPELLKGE